MGISRLLTIVDRRPAGHVVCKRRERNRKVEALRCVGGAVDRVVGGTGYYRCEWQIMFGFLS